MSGDLIPEGDPTDLVAARSSTATDLAKRDGILVTGAAAVAVRAGLEGAASAGVRLAMAGAASAGAGETYRIVASNELASRLADESLRWATPSRGDASVLIKDKAGRIAGHGELQKAGTNPALLVGPAAWEALAMATQQHYLVDITKKLEQLQRGVDELIKGRSDETVGELKHLEKQAALIYRAMEREEFRSTERLADLRRVAEQADRRWLQLAETAERQAREYAAGTAGRETVEASLGELLQATQVLFRCSETLMRVPVGASDALANTVEGERERLEDVMPRLQRLSGDLLAASMKWNRDEAAYIDRTGSAVRRGLAHVPVRGLHVARPRQRSLHHNTAWFVGVLSTTEVPPPDAIVVELEDEGDVRLAIEAAPYAGDVDDVNPM